MDSEKVIKRDNEYVLHTYNRNPVVLEKGHGLYAEGPEGQKYLDFTSGIGVNSLGYCDLAWAEAVSDQAHKLQHTSNLYYTAPCGKLAKKLCKRTGQSRVFFGNSGAEANEGAIKAARKYSVDHYGKDRTTVITLVNSFHGRTIATLTATGQEVFHNYFGPFNEGFLYAPAGDIEALQELVDRNTCAVMLELIQGEGGVMALDPDYVQAVRKLCDEKDLVLIVDEVQTGVGRTGTFLCCEHYNLKPDVVTLAKGLGGGLPIGAVLMNEKVAEGMGPGTHGSTFGGNPVVCAGANVVVDRMDQSFLANVNERAVQLRAGIAKLPHVKSISGIGLMVGIEFYDVTAADVLAALRSYAADAKFVHGSAKELLIEDGRCVGVRTSDGKNHRAAHVLVTTGGTSYPATGSDGSGYKLARQAGHTIVPPQPSLCSLVSPDPACRQMMGLSLRNVTLTLLKDGKPLFTEQGEALFTHFGISGPLVLSASTYIDDVQLHRYIAEFDLKPALDEKTLYDRLTRDFAALGGHSAQGALEKLLPNSMRPVAVKKWGVDPATRAAQITREQKMALVHLCKHWQVPISELGDLQHAVITAGGVDTKEVDPKTMQSKLCPGLYFAGEVLDVDARTGGYNLQIAWATAQAAVRAIGNDT